MRKHMPRTSTMQQLMNLKYNKEGIRKKCEYTFNKLMMDMERYMYNMKEKQRKEYAEVVRLPILLPSVLCFLFPVAVRVCCRRLGCLQLKWCRRPYLSKGRLLKVIYSSKRRSEQQLMFQRTITQWNNAIRLA